MLRIVLLFLLLIITAKAQPQLLEVRGELPLVTVGDRPGWSPSGDTFEFELEDASQVELWVYSPGIDVVNQPGDERYNDAGISSEFSLLNANTREVLTTLHLNTGASDWELIHAGSLPAGQYNVQSFVIGDGKNTFLPSLTVDGVNVLLKSFRPTINVSSESFTPAIVFDVTQDVGCELQMFDADGEEELRARLLTPAGQYAAVPVSGDQEWAGSTLTAGAGRYTVELAKQADAFQATNSVRFRVLCDEQAVPVSVITGDTKRVLPPLTVQPVTVTVIDTDGNLLDIPTSISGKTDRTVRLGEHENYVLVDTRLTNGEQLANGDAAFGVSGGAVTFVLERYIQIAPPQPLIALNELQDIPQPAILIELSTPTPLPAPAVEVAVPQTALTLSRDVTHDSMLPCEINDVTLTVHNPGASALEYVLTETLPEGVVLVDANTQQLVWQGVVAPGAFVTHRYAVTAGSYAQERSSVTAVLSAANTHETNAFELKTMQVRLEVEPLDDEARYVGDTFQVRLTAFNPLNRDVSLSLSQVAARLSIVDAPDFMTVPAGASASTIITLEAQAEGVAVFQATPFSCASTNQVPAGLAATYRTSVQAVPELPKPVQRTVVTVDMAAYQLPVIDGLVLVQTLSETVQYLSGSTLINGQASPDPQQADRALIFELNNSSIASVSFTVLHEAPFVASAEDSHLIALTPEPELIIGEAFALDTYARAVPVDTDVFVRERAGAVILSPAPDAVIRNGNSVSVSVDTPLHARVRLFVNDVEVDEGRIGQRAFDEGLMRQTFDYIGVTLLEGPNAVRVESVTDTGEVLTDEVTVFVAGLPAMVTFTPLSVLQADSVTPLRFDVSVTDAWGNVPQDGFVTVEVENALPGVADANEQQIGYQVRFQKGHAELVLEAVDEPRDVVLTAVVGKDLQTQTFTILSNPRPWIVNGYGSVGAGVNLADGSTSFGVAGGVFARGSVFGDYLFTVSAHYPTTELGQYGDPYETFPVSGSSNALNQDALSRHGVYARLERNLSYVQYGDFVANLDGLLLNNPRTFTGLSAQYAPVSSGVRLKTYAAYASVSDRINEEIASRGLSVYQLSNKPIVESSLVLEIFKRDAATDSVIVEDNDPFTGVLAPLVGYTIDEQAGIIQLPFPLPETDTLGNRYYLKANYRVINESNGERNLQFGVQAGYQRDNYTLSAGMYQENAANDDFTRVVAMNASTTVGAVQANAELGYGQNQESGGVAALVRVSYQQDAISAEARYQYYATGYRSVNQTDDTNAGHSLRVAATYAVNERLAITADAQLTNTSNAESTQFGATLMGTYLYPEAIKTNGQSIGRYAIAEFGVQYENNAFSTLLGGSIRDIFGLEGTELSINHQQSLSANQRSVTDFSVAYEILDNLVIRLTERLEWGNESVFFVGFESGFENSDLLRFICARRLCDLTDPGVSLGLTTVTAQYEFAGGLSGEAGRVRLGLNSSYPVDEDFTVDGSVAQVIDLNADGQNSTTVTLGATYDTETVDANARYEVNLGSSTTHVLTAGTTFAISQELYSSITVAYLNDSANEVRQGLKFSVAAAYRGDDLNLLTNQTARFGLYAEDEGTEISGDTRVSVPLDETWGISAGYIYQYLAGVGYQDLVSVGVTGNLWDSGSVTAYGRLFHDWTNQSFSAGLSLEASQQIGCGVYGVAGYNFFDGKGMSGAPFYARSGLYVRFDIAFDEEWQCGAGSVGDRVFVDANNNGVQDEQETGLAGVEIALYSDKGNLVARTFSDKNGAYAFNRVNPGDYYIKVAAPFKFAFSAYQQGEDALLDSDISPETFSSHIFTITWNHHIIDLDIGLVPLEGENQP